MGDPELRSDEKVLVRTPGVYVKSIPFEGILTNKRIILVDRAKNLLPPKEIPLVTIKETEPGENAIRDQIITLSVMAKTGETRQMILTFSRQAGGNRIKERDTWIRLIKENASSSFDQVIRKVIPGSEPVPRKTEPAPAPRYEVVHSPLPQPSAPQDTRQAGPADIISPVRRAVVTRPETPAPAPAPVRPYEPPVPDTSVFCTKCGNKVPADSVFCNRCGTPIARGQAVSAPVYTPPSSMPVQPVSAPVQTPAVPAQFRTQPAYPAARTPAARPIDEEIQSIEPLIERDATRVPADILRTPVEAPQRAPLSWEEDEETEPSETPLPGKESSGKGFIPRLFSAKSDGASATAPATSYYDEEENPPPPKPPRGRSFLPEKATLFKAAGAIVVIVILAVAGMVIYPIITSGGLSLPAGSENESSSPSTSTTQAVLTQGTIVFRETPAVSVPPTGAYVHVNYMGGFKGSYGIPDMLTTVPGNSGDRLWEVENATNSTVTASFEKLDGSSHEILVEIYRDGKLMTSGTTTVGHGSVTLSVDMITGVAAAPVTSGNAPVSEKAAVAVATTTPAATTAEGTVNPQPSG